MSAAALSPETEQPVSLAESKALLARSRLFGKISAIIFILAALAVFDALQNLIRHEFNSINAVPGERILVSGMLPAKASSYKDIEVLLEGDPGVSFAPFESYKGFWMGGQMWRGELIIAPDAGGEHSGITMGASRNERENLPGRAVLTIVDYLPLKKDASAPENTEEEFGPQNPALVYSVLIWPTEEARQAAAISLFRRYTGFPPFGVAVGAVLFAILVGVANWWTFGRAERGLAGHDVFFIHGIKDLGLATRKDKVKESGFKTAFARAGRPFALGDEVALLDRDWREQSRGEIVEVTNIKAFALFPQDGVNPQYGWLVTRIDEQ